MDRKGIAAGKIILVTASALTITMGVLKTGGNFDTQLPEQQAFDKNLDCFPKT